jgi:hypothetical protein
MREREKNDLFAEDMRDTFLMPWDRLGFPTTETTDIFDSRDLHLSILKKRGFVPSGHDEPMPSTHEPPCVAVMPYSHLQLGSRLFLGSFLFLGT